MLLTSITQDGWKTTTIVPGAYEVKQIDADIKRQINDNEAIHIIARSENDRLGIIIKERFQVDKNINNTITNLGFTKITTPLLKGYHYHLADNPIVISVVHTVDLECNVI